MPLKIKPCHLRAAREYVCRYHRHSIPPVGGKFAVACYDGDNLCGVAICSRTCEGTAREKGQKSPPAATLGLHNAYTSAIIGL